MSQQQQRTDALKSLQALANDKEGLKTTLVDFASQLNKDERKQLAKAIGDPSEKTRDWLWLIVVVTCAVILVGAAAVLAVAVFWTQDSSKTYLAKTDVILTVFTTIFGFLAGVFVPSPVSDKKT